MRTTTTTTTKSTRQVSSGLFKMQRNFAQLRDMIFKGFSVVTPIKGKTITLFAGQTGAGKTTLMHLMSGCVLEKKGSSLNAKIFCVSHKKGTLNGVIGYGTKPETRYPTLHQLGANYCDLPGFGDSRPLNIRITNAITTELAVKWAEKVKGIVIPIKYSCLGGKADFIKSLGGFVQKFIPDFQKYEKSFLFLVTHIPQGTDLDKTKGEILKNLNSLTIDDLEDAGFENISRDKTVNFTSFEKKSKTMKLSDEEKEYIAKASFMNFLAKKFKQAILVDYRKGKVATTRTAIKSAISQLRFLPTTAFKFSQYSKARMGFNNLVKRISSRLISDSSQRQHIATVMELQREQLQTETTKGKMIQESINQLQGKESSISLQSLNARIEKNKKSIKGFQESIKIEKLSLEKKKKQFRLFSKELVPYVHLEVPRQFRFRAKTTILEYQTELKKIGKPVKAFKKVARILQNMTLTEEDNNPEGGRYEVSLTSKSLSTSYARLTVLVSRQSHPDTQRSVIDRRTQINKMGGEKLKEKNLLIDRYKEEIRTIQGLVRLSPTLRTLQKGEKDKALRSERTKSLFTKKSVIEINKKIKQYEDDAKKVSARIEKNKKTYQMFYEILRFLKFTSPLVRKFCKRFEALQRKYMTFDKVPARFKDPLSLGLYRSPYLANCGDSFSLVYVKQIKNKPCPICRREITHLFPNNGLKDSVQYWQNKSHKQRLQKQKESNLLYGHLLPNSQTAEKLEKFKTQLQSKLQKLQTQVRKLNEQIGIIADRGKEIGKKLSKTTTR